MWGEGRVHLTHVSVFSCVFFFLPPRFTRHGADDYYDDDYYYCYYYTFVLCMHIRNLFTKNQNLCAFTLLVALLF